MEELERKKRLLSKRRDRPCSWMGRFKIAKMTILPKLISNFKHGPNKILSSSGFFGLLLDRMILELLWRNKDARRVRKPGEKQSPEGDACRTRHRNVDPSTVMRTYGTNTRSTSQTSERKIIMHN